MDNSVLPIVTTVAGQMSRTNPAMPDETIPPSGQTFPPFRQVQPPDVGEELVVQLSTESLSSTEESSPYSNTLKLPYWNETFLKMAIRSSFGRQSAAVATCNLQ